jgi:hypothetical protein
MQPTLQHDDPKDLKMAASLTALVEYNPTLLPLTSDFDPVLLNYLTGRYHEDISDQEADKVKYLSIARGANLHNCGGGGKNMRRMYNPTKEHSYLTLALLDGDLQPIPGASASLRLAQAVLPSKCYNRGMMEPFQDYQIIAVRSTKGNDKKDQLFVMASDKPTHIFAIDIRRVPAPTNDASGWDTKVKGRPIPMIAKNENELHQFYGQGLQVRLMEDNITPGKKKFCTAVLNSNAMDFQKNYHIFEAHRDGDGALNTYMEIRPHGRRSTRKVNFYADRFHKVGDWELVPNGTIISGGKQGHRDKGDVIVNKASDSPEDQWKYPFPDKTEWKDAASRGTACCIDLAWSSNETVKVGISHGVSEERGYVSRFYAFETKSSRFRNVAVSGPFCLGRMTEYDVNAETQIFPYPERYNLVIGNETYDCPKITFASGLVDYQADTNYAVLSYGVNDCYSRSIVISKDRIREFLNLSGGGSLIAAQ